MPAVEAPTPTQLPSESAPAGGVDPQTLQIVRGIAKLFDNAIPVPGTNYRFGLDSIIGLIPGVGDALSALVSSYIISTAANLGVSRMVLMRMMLNVGIDAVLGAVPIVGDVFDAAWKANAKNAALLERSLLEPREARRSSTWVIVALVGTILLVTASGVILGVLLLRWLLT